MKISKTELPPEEIGKFSSECVAVKCLKLVTKAIAKLLHGVNLTP